MPIENWITKLESLQPDKIKLGLERVDSVAKTLNLQHPVPKVITIAGTNGKGSTQCLIAGILESAGYKVGVYTSPHLIRFNERIKINGKEISDDELCAAFNRVDNARGNTELTYFEFTTLAALDYFSKANLDVLLLEVGLGGRLDAVNIIDSDISVITNISIDHQSWLGINREQIGFEKAGVFRAEHAAVFGAINLPYSIRKYAEKLQVELHIQGKHFNYAMADETINGEACWQWQGKIDNNYIYFKHLPLPTLGLENAATAIQTILLLDNTINIDAIKSGLKAAKLPGRYQKLNTNVPTILDVAHNTEAVTKLALNLQSEVILGKKYALFGILNDKDYEAIISIMLPQIDHWTICEPMSTRAKPGQEIVECLKQTQNTKVDFCSNIAEALYHLYQKLHPDDLLIVFGSFYTISETMQYIDAHEVG